MSTISSLAVVSSSNVTVGTHGLTTRCTYTVPSGKRAVLRLYTMEMLTPGGIAAGQAVIQVLLNGVFFAHTSCSGGAQALISDVGIDIPLNQADVVIIQTTNVSALNVVFVTSLVAEEYQT